MNIAFSATPKATVKPQFGEATRSREELTAHVWQELGERFDRSLEVLDDASKGKNGTMVNGNWKYFNQTKIFETAELMVNNMTRLAAAFTSPDYLNTGS